MGDDGKIYTYFTVGVGWSLGGGANVGKIYLLYKWRRLGGEVSVKFNYFTVGKGYRDGRGVFSIGNFYLLYSWRRMGDGRGARQNNFLS